LSASTAKPWAGCLNILLSVRKALAPAVFRRFTVSKATSTG
jgi:hypothetical protein